MKVTFVSNYINHHQIPFCDALYQKLGSDFCFIQTEQMEEERVRMGWAVDVRTHPYVELLERSERSCRERIDTCDLLLAGWTRREELFEKRLGSGKPVLRISERLYREGQWKAISPRGLLHKYKDHTRYRHKPVYLLCAGAYVASDYALVHAYPGKMFRFGYFPEQIFHKRRELMDAKGEAEPVQIVWAGRFMPLKHPEFAVRLADDLKKLGRNYHLHLIGSGEMEEELRSRINECGLTDTVTMYGFLKPDRVRRIMEHSHIYLFTSNHLEGWGAVVNEAMNSGCCVVADRQAGAVPYLLRDKENGLIYRDEEYESFLSQVLYLTDHPGERERMGWAAYETICTDWNADEAAKRLLQFYGSWQSGTIVAPEHGPFSPAPVLKPEWEQTWRKRK